MVGATIAEHEGRAIIAEVAGIGDGTVPLASARALIPAAMTARSVEVPPSETTRQWIVQGLNHDNPFGGNTRPVLSILAEILRHVTHGPPPKSRK